jgi:DNA-binding LytR/AlgR family response regulator
MVLSQPYPLVSDMKSTLRFCVIAALFVFLFLWIFQPFGLANLSSEKILLSAAVFGTVTLVTSFLLNMAFYRLLPAIFDEERWTVGKEIASMLVQTIVIALANLVCFRLLYNTQVSISAFMTVLWITAAVGAFPFGLLVVLKNNRLSQMHAAEAAKIEEQLHQPTADPVTVHPPEKITLTDQNDKNAIQLTANDLVYLQSADNYTRIYHLAKGELQLSMLRSTLRRMEEMLSPIDSLYRCHRMYIVNLQHVEHLSGNAQGLRLKLKGSEETIPVSRNLQKETAEKLKAIHPQS